MTDRRMTISLLVLTTCISLMAIYFSYTWHVMLAYNDATAHLNTARRVIDNLTPGLVQLGSVWLPLLHILELPFVTSFFLWQSGLAGAIVSSICFILSAILLYKTLFYITRNVWASCIGTLALITNPNLLYLQTTAMFEPLLLVTEIAAVYYLLHWIRENSLPHLILAAFFTMLATLTRYDGWALFAAGSTLVLVVSLLRRKAKEGPFFIFVTLAGFGILLWLLYNQAIFSDALYFMRGEYSAAAQQQVLAAHHYLPTKHNVILSIEVYTQAMILNNGIVILALSGIGLIIFLLSMYKKLFYLAPLILLVPFAFNCLALYMGQSVIWIPTLPPYLHTYFNIRYGILMLPAIAFFIGFLASKHITLALAAFAAIGLQVALFLYMPHPLITLEDTVSAVNNQTTHASAFLHTHYQGGLILASSASSDAFIFRAGIPLKNFITEGTGYYWRNSLKNPGLYATWLVFFQDHTDRVGKQMPSSTTLEKTFTLVYQDQTYQIWKKKSSL